MSDTLPEAMQHTRAVIALTSMQMVIEVFPAFQNVPNEKKIKAQLARIQRWIDACKIQTVKRRLSSGAKRDIERCFAMLGEFSDYLHMADDECYPRWLALVWTSLIFIEDVRCICPFYFHGEQKTAWRYFLQTVNTLAEMLRKDFPFDNLGQTIMDLQGTHIYVLAACALDNEPYDWWWKQEKAA